MNLISKKQFAGLCGLKTNRLAVEIERGKISVTGDKIDLDIEQNAKFIQKYQEKRNPPAASQEETQIKQEVEDQFSAVESFVGLKDLDNIKKVEETKRIIVDTRLKLLKEAKDKGENVPTEGVKTIISILSKTVISKFHTAADNLLMDIAKRKSLSREEVAELRKVLIDVVNEASDSAVNEAQRDLKNLVKQTKVKKGVGEHD